MTTAEVFADYLGLTPENAPWAYDATCNLCRGNYILSEGDMHTLPYHCPNCFKGVLHSPRLTATSPLAPEPTPGWLEALVRHKKFNGLCNYRGNRFRAQWGETAITFAPHPTHAVARALIAADPTLRAACERASDYNKETPNV